MTEAFLVSGVRTPQRKYGGALAGGRPDDLAALVLLAGLPSKVPGYTVNRLCASGLTAVISAAQAIKAGEADVIVRLVSVAADEFAPPVAVSG